MPMTPKKIPERRCVGCGERKAKNEMIRVLRTPDGTIVLDRTGKLSGRGAYLCPSVTCLKKARKTRRIETNLEVAVPEEVYGQLEKELAKQA